MSFQSRQRCFSEKLEAKAMLPTGRLHLPCLLLLLSACLHRLCSGQCQTAGRFGEDCQHQCHCQQACDPLTGRCPSNCTRGYEGPTCQKRNVALGKQTNASSVYPMATPDKAVDGDTRQVIDLETNRYFCFHSAVGQSSSWWYVDLGAVFPMNDIVIYYRIPQVQRFQGAVVIVANSSGAETTCATITRSSLCTGSIIRLSCPLSGQRLVLRHRENCDQCLLEPCEVQVFVCAAGFFGHECSRMCAACQGGRPCDHVTGECPHDHVTVQSGISEELQETAIQAAVDSGFSAGHSSGLREGVGVGAGAVLGVVLLTVVSLAVVCSRRRQRLRNGEDNQYGIQDSEAGTDGRNDVST